AGERRRQVLGAGPPSGGAGDAAGVVESDHPVTAAGEVQSVGPAPAADVDDRVRRGPPLAELPGQGRRREVLLGPLAAQCALPLAALAHRRPEPAVEAAGDVGAGLVAEG